MITLRPHQIKAVAAVEAAFASGVRRPLVDACVGAGKSLMYAKLARNAWDRGERTIICAHTRELVKQNAEACELLGVPVAINAAALNQRTWRAPVISAAIQSVYKYGEQFGNVHLMCGDECFPAGTLIATPIGQIPIEQIRTGEIVFNALGQGEVEVISQRLTDELVEIEFDDGSKFYCTETHFLFTLQGWKPAGSLEAGSVVLSQKEVRALRERNASKLGERWERKNETSLSVDMESDSVLFNILLEEARESDVESRREGKNVGYTARNETWTEDQRWQWSRNDEGTSGVNLSARRRLGIGISDPNLSTDRLRLSDTLQNRHSESKIADCDRSGWSFSRGETKTFRQEEGHASSVMGVARVSRIKLTSPCHVYNLQVAGHPSYFANGFLAHNCHLWPHSESGMYRTLHRALGYPNLVGGSGTVFRLQGGSLVEGEEAPFERVVFTYSILDGIRDGYLVPAFTASVDDKIDPKKLQTRNGEFTGASQDEQTIASMDNHIAQIVHYGQDRQAWILFEASEKAAVAMAKRMREWGIPTGLVLGKTPAAEREATIEQYRAGRLRALVNIAALTTGFDVQKTDLLIMRRRTKSLGLYIQIAGRALRTIGGHIEKSIVAGKSDALFLDFAGNIDAHGPLDCIRPKESKARFTRCDCCGTLNASAAMRCWSCGAELTKNCPMCLSAIAKDLLDCPVCGFDMRMDEAPERGAGLFDRPTDSAIISAYSSGSERKGGWQPIRKAWEVEAGTLIETEQNAAVFPISGTCMRGVRWARFDGDGDIDSVLVPNGTSRSSALQINREGVQLIVPLPASC